jgi:arginine/lysine/ornithine decarboxylase
MNIKQQKKTPILTALKKYMKEDIVHFDVPGHKKRNNPELRSAFGDIILKMDANSTPDLDMLGNPTGIIMEAESLLADAFGADEAFLLVNGSTSGVQYMIMTACMPKEKIIMPRNVHKSAINAVILSGAQPVFVEPEIDLKFGISNGVTFESIKKAIYDHPDAKAVFLINPTYFGATSDLAAIVKLAHRAKMLAIVDESHGTHFPFHPDLPFSAMETGADMATVSVHKTGGALTQSSALLLNERVVKRHQVRSIINLFQTTSASYILMASIDVARKKLAIQGKAMFDVLLKQVEQTKREIASIPGLEVISRDYINGQGVHDFDDTKIVIRVNDLGFTGFEVYNLMKSQYNVQLELAETYVVLAIASIGDDIGTLKKLSDALQDLSANYYGKREPLTHSLTGLLGKPKSVISPREAFYSNKRLVPLDEAVGEVCAESIMIYPPGIPLCIPGEMLTEDIIDYYKFYKSQKCVVINDDENPDYIKILGD